MTNKQADIRSPIRTLPSAAAALSLLGFVGILLGAPADAVASGGRHVRKPSETQLARLQQYEEYIDYFGTLTYGPGKSAVSPEYIRALILTESAAQKYAVSHKGARGLTQIMPETGRMAASEIVASGIDYRFVDESHLARYNPDVLYDPAINILIACYLGALYHTDYRGRTDLVAAAWNAGPQAVARYGNQTPPYRETRGMVHRLVGFLNFFASETDDRRQTSSRWSNFTSSRWDTSGWNDPEWDEKKVDWELPF